MSNQQTAIRVRFAPSPTGHLHIGGLRTALFNWLYARHTGGTYLVRVEDTDLTRSTQAYVDSQQASLAWADLRPDEALVYQMQRQPEHIKQAHWLMEKGLAYPCFCAPRDAEDLVRNLEQGVGQKYDNTCRSKAYDASDLQKPHAIRYKHDAVGPDIEFHDLIRGTIKIKADQLDDFVIIRRDGAPTYNFCVVVDDIFMKITHIIRGEDHISNTPKQVVLYAALDAKPPYFAHLPLILGKAGNKLSKRDASVSVEEYRAQGYVIDALVNYLVRLGWSHGDQEIFSRDELVNFFSLDQVGKKGAIFDLEKLEWLNGVYIRKMSPKELLHAIELMDSSVTKNLSALWSEEKLATLFELYKQRSTMLTTLSNEIISFATDPVELDVALIAKWKNENTKPLLALFAERLATAESLKHADLLAGAQEVCTQFGEKLVGLAQALRLALTGKVQSPGVFELIEVIGKERALARINKLVNQL